MDRSLVVHVVVSFELLLLVLVAVAAAGPWQVNAFLPPPCSGGRPTATATTIFQSCSRLLAVKTNEEILTIVREGIAENDATDAWNDCVTFLQDYTSTGSSRTDDTTDNAEMLLATALEWRGWARVSSAMARKYMKPKQPNLQQLQAAIEWLQEGPLQLSKDLLVTAIPQSPTAYLVDPEAAYQEALRTAPKQYQNPTEFHALLLQDPSVLECSYNCVDDGCASECGNCWVSYQTKRGM